MVSVAGLAASAIVDRLVDEVLDLASASWWPRARILKSEAEKLRGTLPEIKAVLGAVSQDQIKLRSLDLDAWLWRFRDAVEEADDVLDEIKYYDIEEKVKARDGEVSGRVSGYKRKLIDFVKSGFVNDGVLSKLRKAVKELEAVALDVGPFLKLVDCVNQDGVENRSNFRETGSLLTESAVVGLENELNVMVDWLTAKPVGHEKKGPLSAFAIFGIGGMGKTTLAQLVCNDQRVIGNFDLIAWVCVSDNSGAVDAKTVIRKIIEDVTKEKCGLDNLNALQNNLKEKVACKKLLLVFDDVWRDDMLSEWEKIVAPLKFGQGGNKIVLTTRMKSVADMIVGLIDGEKKCVKLNGLEEGDFKTLFYRHAFAGADPSEHQHLHEIGNKIANKLWACPLAAKVIGGVLSNGIDFQFWNKILHEDILNTHTNKDNVMNILKLSYHHLPAHLQLCFRYCSIFPQDYRFKKDELAKMWMGSGLVPHDAHQKSRPEDVADECFNQLVGKSFFSMERTNEHSGETGIEYYFVHDLLHELAQSVSAGECLRITDDDAVIPRTIRHLSIAMKSYFTLKEICNLNKLHTLVISEEHDSDDEIPLNEIISGLKGLRLLRLSMIREYKFPSSIGDLIHLRYLSLEGWWTSGEQVHWFPRSIYRLYHLEIMQLKWNASISINESEMKSMCKLINLRYLTLPFYSYHLIPRVGELSSLQELNAFYVKNTSGYKITELKPLKDLHKLCIYDLNNVNKPKDAIEAQLSRKAHLKSLELYWCHKPFRDGVRDEHVADNLHPPVNLNELQISGYVGVRSPCWMANQACCNLTIVKLYKCLRWEHLPPLGQLNSLKHLYLKSMNAVKKIGHSFYGNGANLGACVFPSLRFLEFDDMPEWVEWVGAGDKLFCPHLHELRIETCPKLKGLPSLPLSLRSLNIDNAALKALPQLYRVQVDNNMVGTSSTPLTPCLSFLKVHGCPNIDTLVGSQLLRKPEDFRALKEISIKRCRNLAHMPRQLLAKLPSLETLTILDCPKLVTSEMQLPPMLKNLAFGSYGNLEPSFINSLHDLSFLTKLEMDGCASMQFLPRAEVFEKLIALRHLEVKRCKELVSLSGIQNLTTLENLIIYECKKLNEFSSLLQPLSPSSDNQVDLSTGHHLKLNKLIIDHSALLLMEPLRSLRTKFFQIFNDSQITSLPEQWLLQNRLSLEALELSGLSNLHLLSQSLERLCSLQQLFIVDTQMLRSLPNLPSSLISLRIHGCHPELEELCRAQTGLYWPMISRIRYVQIWANVESVALLL
ncbi:hypothetical protein LUZ60_007521 [Juncus effusus]|nr:hypothetical protein LUZ60_007521 [Juncus effusus]